MSMSHLHHADFGMVWGVLENGPESFHQGGKAWTFHIKAEDCPERMCWPRAPALSLSGLSGPFHSPFSHMHPRPSFPTRIMVLARYAGLFHSGA
jgi:hypothetical protein